MVGDLLEWNNNHKFVGLSSFLIHVSQHFNVEITTFNVDRDTCIRKDESITINYFNILLVVKINIAHTLNAHWLPHNHHKKFTMDKGKTFLNLLVTQCCQTNTHLLIFWTGKGWEGRKKLLHWTAKNKKSMETDSLKCHLCPGSISVRELHFTPLSPSSETQGQIVGARESLK